MLQDHSSKYKFILKEHVTAIRNLNYTQEISSCLLIVYVIYINMNRTRWFRCHYFVFSFNARFYSLVK